MRRTRPRSCRADLRAPDEILDHPHLRDLIDFRDPVAVLAVAVLHFLDDHDSVTVVSRLRQAAATGSYLVISHASPGTRSHGDVGEAAEACAKTTAPVWVRTPDQIRCYFTGFDVVEPGLVPVQDWRPDVTPVDPARLGMQARGSSPRGVFLAGVARLPGGDDV